MLSQGEGLQKSLRSSGGKHTTTVSVWVCVRERSFSPCAHEHRRLCAGKYAFICVYFCLCTSVHLYVTVLFPKPVAMVSNSLKSLCWRTGHLLEREDPQTERWGPMRGRKRGYREGEMKRDAEAKRQKQRECQSQKNLISMLYLDTEWM